MGYRVKRKCIWCGAVKEPFAVRKAGESVLEFFSRQIGPVGCRAPDGDGHLWEPKRPLHDVEEKAKHVN